MRILLAIIVFVLCCSVAGGQEISVFGDTFPQVKENQRLVYRHLYVACVDVEAKQPAWIGYRVKKSDWDSGNQLARNFNTPAELRDICLEVGDYDKSGYELGHLYGIQFVHARQDGHEVNQLCAIAAMTPELNKGPWYAAEMRLKELSETSTVTVLAGQLWETPMKAMPNANEPHKVASHCWMMFDAGDVKESYLFPQVVKRTDALQTFKINRNDLQGKIAEKWVNQ